MLFQNDETMEFLKSIIRIGEVSSVDAAKGTARVVFDDFDSVVSYDLQVICRNTIANRDYAMPDVGEDVICIFLPTGTEAGFILGSVYAGEITPPENTINRRCVEFSDGTKIMYDRSAHELTAAIGDTRITANRSGVDVQSTGTVHVKVGETEATISNSGVSIKGDLTVTGKVTASGNLTSTGGDVLAGLISLASHMHVCAAPGATSGTPTMTPQAPETPET